MAPSTRAPDALAPTCGTLSREAARRPAAGPPAHGSFAAASAATARRRLPTPPGATRAAAAPRPRVPATPGVPATRRPGVPRHAPAGAAAAAVLAAAALAPVDASLDARLAVAVFGLAVVGWVATRVGDVRVALAAAGALVLLGVQAPAAIPAALVDTTLLLLLGAFVVAGAVARSGLAERLAIAVAVRSRTVGGLVHGLSAAVAATAFVVPSTSGRAALLVPVFVALASAVGDRRVVRALALAVPTAVLLSAVASLVGAGAHLVTAQLVAAGGHGELGYARWLLLGAPFALCSCAVASLTISRLFLTADERRRPLRLTAEELTPDGRGHGPLAPKERRVLAVVGVLVAAWALEARHGVPAHVVALLGAAAVLLPGVGAPVAGRPAPLLGLRAARDAVDAKILVFLAATLLLGDALVRTGAADALAGGVLGPLAAAGTLAPWLAVGVVAVVSLLAHLVVTSRTARSTVLVPIVLMLAAAVGLEPAALAFLSTAAAGFCLTLPVSAKPVLLFGRLEGETFAPADLLRLSRVLLPVHLALLLLFALLVWPALGLPLLAS